MGNKGYIYTYIQVFLYLRRAIFPFAFRDLPPESIRRKRKRKREKRDGGFLSLSLSLQDVSIHRVEIRACTQSPAQFRAISIKISTRDKISTSLFLSLSLHLDKDLYYRIRFSTSEQFIGIFRD